VKNNFWFYIETYVHIGIKKQQDLIMLYNSLTGNLLEYSYSDHPDILKTVRRLKLSDHFQLILLNDKDMKNQSIRDFINAVKRFFMGDIINVSYSRVQPTQLPPVIKIHKDVNYLKKEKLRSVGEDIMNYLSEISLYICNFCKQNCCICNNAYKQFLCCYAEKNKCELNMKEICFLFEEIKNISIKRLNILGGNILDYSYLKKIIFYVSSLGISTDFYIHYLNIFENLHCLDHFQRCKKHAKIKVIVAFPLKENLFRTVVDSIKSYGLNFSFVFVVQEESDFEVIDSLSYLDTDLQDALFQPYYNMRNLDFFKHNTFIDREDIKNFCPSMKDIYLNSFINSLNFGRLTILADGRIYADLNQAYHGILGKQSLSEIVYTEMKKGSSWRRVRKHMDPCKNCIFEVLCPPLSGYNYAIKKNNLCNIWKESK